MRRARSALVLALVLSLVTVLFGASEAAPKEGKKVYTNIIVCIENPCFGVGENETILGTNNHEQIHAPQGSDQLSGFDGSDVIAGDDELQEERFLTTQPGLTTLTDGNDRIDAGAGDDGPVRGFGGSDVLLGDEGNDTIDAREFSQRLGSDFVGGGPGDDSISAKDGAFDDIDCGEGTDTITSLDEGLDSVSPNCENVF